MRNLLEPIVTSAIEDQVTPGAVVLVSSKGNILCHEAFGTSANQTDGGIAVSLESIYDAASLTKAAVTSCLLMLLVAEGAISLESLVLPYLKELQGVGKDKIRVKDLLGHASGLPAHKLFYERIGSGDLGGTDNVRDALVQMAGETPLAYDTGSQTVYSDLGYILLGRLIERVSNHSLEDLFQKRIALPLSMRNSCFSDLRATHDSSLDLHRCVPTKTLEGQNILLGQVHDDNCRMGGGICGHAGLFTTTGDLAKLAQNLCHAFLGKPSIFCTAVVKSFWDTSAASQTSWRMGWDTSSRIPGISHAGDRWPSGGVGHLGFTGTALWLAPKQDTFVIFLTNRVYYPHQAPPIKALRRELMHAITEALPIL